ncbi:MAG: PHP domain-containing protein, partial [Clostridia bacterium]|nr:PHP domain-containing protein [Clostridia bacterium]
PLLMDTLKDLGFRAVTYMPSRNTDAQLSRIMGICRDYGFFEISGEDINSSRQSFICPALAKPECAHLAPAAFALIGHELAATEDVAKGMFRPEAIEKFPSLTDRVNYYSKLEF